MFEMNLGKWFHSHEMLSILFLSVSRILCAKIMQKVNAQSAVNCITKLELKNFVTNEPGISHIQSIGSSSITP